MRVGCGKTIVFFTEQQRKRYEYWKDITTLRIREKLQEEKELLTGESRKTERLKELDNIEREKEMQTHRAKIEAGRLIATKIGVNYTVFKSVLLKGVNSEAPEDWIVTLYQDYLFDLDRLSYVLTPVGWLCVYAQESWSEERYEKA